jgi:cysteine synthase
MAQNLTALNMLLDNPPPKNATIIEQSSGSTATSLAMVARVLYGNENTRAYVSNKAGMSRIRQLRFFGLNVYVYFPCVVSYIPALIYSAPVSEGVFLRRRV